MIPLPRRALAEVIGTFFLCFTGISAICMDRYLTSSHGGPGVIGVALAHGLALAIAISALGKVSGGHFNPAVTAAMVATKQMPPIPGIVYVVSQVVGGLLGGLACGAAYNAVRPPDGAISIYAEMAGGVPLPNPHVAWWALVMLEAIATFFLVTAVFGTAVDPKAPSIGGFGIGLTVTFDILAIGSFTGASMNPARSLGPAIAASLFLSGDHKIWQNHEVYWIGPILGGVIAGLVYKEFFMSRVPPEKPPGSGID